MTIRIDPHSQQRPRGTFKNGKVIVYDPYESKKWKKAFARRVRRALEKKGVNEFPVFQPYKMLSLRVAFFLYKKDARKPALGLSKNDLSNMVKSLEDALNKVLWHDDSQIVHEELEKRNSPLPMIVMEVFEVDREFDETGMIEFKLKKGNDTLF